MKEDVEGAKYADIRRAVSNTKGFGLNGIKNLSDAYDLIDLYSFCENVHEYYPEETTAVMEAITETVIVNQANISNANGLSFYFPCYNRSLVDEHRQLEETFTGRSFDIDCVVEKEN